ncbi:MAG TPA: tetratricopeptide repeat protein [Nitrospira sp.]|nr:tetratricopeptide repeat protein [Nitrospira sp.]
MTYRIKIPPRTLPVDQAHLLSDLEHRLSGIKKYRLPLAVGLLLVVLVGGGIWGVLWYDAQTVRRAQDVEREATLHYLTRPANDPKKTEANLKDAIVLYRKVVDEYPRTPSAPLALFSLGNALLQSNELEPALEAYKRFVSLYGFHHTLLGLVQQKLGYAYLLKGDVEQAAKAYAAVLEIQGAANRDQAQFELARLEESRARPEAASAHYQGLMKAYPNSPLANEAAIRLKVLETKKSPESSAVPAPVVANPNPPKTSATP